MPSAGDWIALVLVPGIAKIHARADLARFGQLGEVGRKRALTCGKIGGFAIVVNSFEDHSLYRKWDRAVSFAKCKHGLTRAIPNRSGWHNL